jgi:hypothetical protein
MNLLQQLIPESTGTVWERLDDDNVRVTATSVFSGRRTSMVLPINKDQETRYNLSSETIQNIFPNLTANQREFLLTGASSDDWDVYVPEEEE